MSTDWKNLEEDLVLYNQYELTRLTMWEEDSSREKSTVEAG